MKCFPFVEALRTEQVFELRTNAVDRTGEGIGLALQRGPGEAQRLPNGQARQQTARGPLLDGPYVQDD